MQRNTLLGFAKIRVPAWHLTIADVAVHTKDGKRWAHTPTSPTFMLPSAGNM